MASHQRVGVAFLKGQSFPDGFVNAVFMNGSALDLEVAIWIRVLVNGMGGQDNESVV
jgi:hypothetical protein